MFEYLVSLSYTPPQTCGCGEITQYFLPKSGSEITCIISGDKRQRETGWFRMCVYSSGEM